MKKLALGAVAAGALVAATAVPALAQVGVYAGPGGISVGAGTPGYYYLQTVPRILQLRAGMEGIHITTAVTDITTTTGED